MIRQPRTAGWVDVDDKTYLADCDRISNSMLKTFLDWRPDFRDYYVLKTRRPDEPSASMWIGSAFHLLLLEPHKFDLTYVYPEDGKNYDRRTKEGKANWQELSDSGREVISLDDLKTIDGMRVASRRHEQLITALNMEGGIRERAFFCEDEATGLTLKGKPDLVLPNGIVVDIKTASDVSKDAWLNQARRLRYHMQAAFYLDCLSRFTKAKTFVHAVVGTYEPYPVVMYRLSERAVDLGRQMYRSALQDLADCIESDDWIDPAEIGINEVDFPDWAYRSEV